MEQAATLNSVSRNLQFSFLLFFSLPFPFTTGVTVVFFVARARQLVNE
jgi:hypothetical protein